MCVSRDILLRICLALAGALAAVPPPSLPSVLPLHLPSLLTTCSLCAHTVTAGGESYTDVVRRLEPILVEIERMPPPPPPAPIASTPVSLLSKGLSSPAVCKVQQYAKEGGRREGGCKDLRLCHVP